MKYTDIKHTIVYFFLLLSFSSTAQEAAWELRKNRDGIKVYIREAKNSPFKELKMKFSVEATMSSVVALLQDVEAIPNWVYKCDVSYLVEKVNRDEEYYYNSLNFPWPLSDRDLILKSKLTQDPTTKVFRSESHAVTDKMPEKEGIVRIVDTYLWWEFTPHPNGQIDVDYYLKSDPGGYLPAWIVNMAIDQGPIQTVKHFKKILKSPKYKNVKLDYISEL